MYYGIPRFINTYLRQYQEKGLLKMRFMKIMFKNANLRCYFSSTWYTKKQKRFKNITITKRWNSEKNNCITTNKSLRKCVIHSVGDWQLTNPKNYRIALSTYLITEFRSWVFAMLWTCYRHKVMIIIVIR